MLRISVSSANLSGQVRIKNLSSLNKANGDRRSESANIIIFSACSNEGHDDDIKSNNYNIIIVIKLSLLLLHSKSMVQW